MSGTQLMVLKHISVCNLNGSSTACQASLFPIIPVGLLGVIHKPRGLIFEYFDPLSPSWSPSKKRFTCVCNKMVILLHTHNPQKYTWFMGTPLGWPSFGLISLAIGSDSSMANKKGPFSTHISFKAQEM